MVSHRYGLAHVSGINNYNYQKLSTPALVSHSHLPDVFMRKLLVAELAVVKVPAEMNIPVHPDIVAGSVVLPALHTDVSLLSSRTNWSQHVAFLELRAVRRWVDSCREL